MDITSYLLGKKSSGGGGGSSRDWSEIGYSGEPESIEDGFEYAKYIQENWNGTSTFRNDRNLKYMPVVDYSNLTNAGYLFDSCDKLEYVENFNISSKCNTLYSSFNNTGALNRITFSNDIDTSNVSSWTSAFANTGIKEIDLSNFNFAKANSLQSLFSGCWLLKQVKFGSVVNAPLLVAINYMFQNCGELEEIDLSGFTIAPTSVSYMFDSCLKLRKIDIRNMTLDGATNKSNMFGQDTAHGVPNDCLIIVKDSTQKTWVQTNYSRLTNVVTAEEYENQ